MSHNPPSTILSLMFPSTYQGRSYPTAMSPPPQPSNMETPSPEAEGEKGEIKHEGSEGRTSSATMSQVQDKVVALPQSSALFLQILTEDQYPIFSEILRHLHQFDINNLRGTCHTLRNSLASTYPHLVGSCQAMYPFQSRPSPKNGQGFKFDELMRSGPRKRCVAGPTWSGQVRSCKGDVHKSGRHGDLSNGEEYWICEPCHMCLLPRALSGFGVRQNFNRPVARDTEGKWAVIFPICRACFNCLQLHRPVKKHTRVMGTGDGSDDCTCLKKYDGEVYGGWYCADCIWATAQKLVVPLVQRSRNIRRRYSRLGNEFPILKNSFVCAKCDEVVEKPMAERISQKDVEENPSWMKDPFGPVSNFYMCLGCEDLYVGNKDDTEDKHEGVVSTLGAGSGGEGAKHLHELETALQGMGG